LVADEKGESMALGTSLFLIAVGAILRFAVSVTTHGFNIHTVGVILMIVGIVGLLISLLWMIVWRERQARPGYVDRRDYVERSAPPPEAY
jgi:beta-lactamase regulating signal transducer with metallopeptidase domain